MFIDFRYFIAVGVGFRCAVVVEFILFLVLNFYLVRDCTVWFFDFDIAVAVAGYAAAVGLSDFCFGDSVVAGGGDAQIACLTVDVDIAYYCLFRFTIGVFECPNISTGGWSFSPDLSQSPDLFEIWSTSNSPVWGLRV